MPDVNKFEKLREVGYAIPVTCGLCAHGEFVNNQMHGACRLHRYEHLKHDNPDGGRPVSIVQVGTCSEAEMDYAKSGLLGAHFEFISS